MPVSTAHYTLNLIGPGLIAVFGLGFFFAWLLERNRVYLLSLTGACLLFATAVTVHIFSFPNSVGLNALAGNLFYVSAVLAIASGLLQRSGKRLDRRMAGGAVALTTVLLWYYCYVDPNLSARIYIQNFGFGAILLFTALQLRHLARGKLADRVLYWTLLVFSAQFFPRTIITMHYTPQVSGRDFGTTVFWQVFQLSIAVLGLALVLAMLMAVVSDIIEDMKFQRDTDTLTGLPNRRGFDTHMEAIWARPGFLRPSLVLCDLDHFKRINDDHGHGVGDAVLRSFGDLLSNNMRDADKVFRIGGEEFAIIVYGSTDAAQILIDRLRSIVSAAPFPLPAHVSITASYGVATHERGETAQGWFDRADSALYRAKREGRNRAVFAPNRSAIPTAPEPLDAAARAKQAGRTA